MDFNVGIYKITSPSGRIYIGQSRNLSERFSNYRRLCSQGQTALHRSFLKYGFDSHEVKIIHELPSDVEQSMLDNYERIYHDLYVDCGRMMLNLKEPGLGGKLSEETKSRISASNKGRLCRPLGYKHSPQTIEKIRQSNLLVIKKPTSEETKKKLSISLTGRIFSEESRARMSASQKGRIISEDQRKRHSEFMKGRPSPNKGVQKSEEIKRKISDTLKGMQVTGESLMKRCKSVDQYTKQGEFIASWNSIGEACILTGICDVSIGFSASGKRPSAGGFIWRFKSLTNAN